MLNQHVWACGCVKTLFFAFQKHTCSSDCCDIKEIHGMYLKPNSIRYGREWEMRPNCRLTFSVCLCLTAQVARSLQLIHYPCVWQGIVCHWSFHTGCCCCRVTGVDLKGQCPPLTETVVGKTNKYKSFPNIQMRQGSHICMDRQWILKSGEKNKRGCAVSYTD